MTARYGIAFPQSAAAEPDYPIRTAEFIREVEAAGLDSLWVQEQLLGADPSIEPLTSLAFAAGLTTRIRLGVAVLVAPVRNPVVLAKQVSSLDRLSAGRLTVGLGLGDLPSLYRASGVPRHGQGQRLEDIVSVMSQLWTRPVANLRRGDFDLTAARMEPKPVQVPHPPLWFGARSPASLRRAVRLGNGWVCAGGASLDEFRQLSTHLADLLPDCRRSVFTVAKKVYLAVERDPAVAWTRLTQWFDRHWGPDGARLARVVGVAGTVDDCANQLRELARAGVDLIICNPVYDELTQLHRLVDRVIPRAADG